MKKKASRRIKFEKAEWVMNPVDCMEENPLADKKCKSCSGHGVVDEGHFAGCILSNYPDCWNKKA